MTGIHVYDKHLGSWTLVGSRKMPVLPPLLPGPRLRVCVLSSRPPPQNCMNLPPDKVQLLSQYDNEKKWELICDQVGTGTLPPPEALPWLGWDWLGRRHCHAAQRARTLPRGQCGMWDGAGVLAALAGLWNLPLLEAGLPGDL